MSDQRPPDPRRRAASTDGGPRTAATSADSETGREAGTDVATSDGHGGELDDQLRATPGCPAHVYRRSDIDPKAAQRREREVATFFGLSTLGTLLFIVAYFAIKPADVAGDEMLEQVGLSTKLLGLGLGLALFCIGAGAIHWAKTLMPDDEIVSERKPMRSSDEDRAEAVAALKEGAAGAGLGRRKLIRNSLLGALAPLGLLAIIPLRDLGPLPGASARPTPPGGPASGW